MARRSESMREAGTNGDDLQIEGIHKVLAMSKLRTSYKQFKDRRETPRPLRRLLLRR